MAPLDSAPFDSTSLDNVRSAHVPVDRALALRQKQLQDALDLLIAKHGAQSETVAVIRNRLDDVQAELAGSQVDHTGDESHTGDVISLMGGPHVKDAGLMFAILGGVLLFAFGGMSTMFVLLMSTQW